MKSNNQASKHYLEDGDLNHVDSDNSNVDSQQEQEDANKYGDDQANRDTSGKYNISYVAMNP